MSRIQNILDKAEREGTVRRVRGIEPSASLAPSPSAPLAAGPSAPPSAPPSLEIDAPIRGGAGALDPVTALGGSPSAFLDDIVPSTPLGAGSAFLDDIGPSATLGASAATAVQIESSGQVIPSTRLDRRLVAVSADAVAEQYQALRTRILHAGTGVAVNVLLVTSPGRGEGKTITASNLALTMAQDYQRRICLVDADLRHPQIHQLFGLTDGPGLSDVLAGQATLDQALITIEDLQITLLPAGRAPARPADLLGTTAMRRTLDSLRSRFDRVVVDAPATAPLADVGILTPLVDSVLLVVRAAVTSKPAIHDAVASLDGAKLLGVVLNDAVAA